jgi:glycosyltransferase involved in cell wall biosynthesis
MMNVAEMESWHSARRLVGSGLVSILMPVHNLEQLIAENIRTVHRVLNNQIPFEIVVIDDGSTDGTAATINALRSEIPELRPVLLDRNVGKGAALRYGFEKARGTHIVFLDGDLDIPPFQIPRFFRIMAETGAAVVIGSKQHPDSVLQYPWLRRIMSGIYYRLVKCLIGLPVRDTQTGLKLFARAALEWAFPRILIKAFAYDLELLALVHLKGYRIAEAPVVIEFHSRWGFVRPMVVRAIILDTLAIFYRLRIVKYYQTIPDTCVPDKPPLVSILIAYPASSAFLDEVVRAIDRQTYTNFEVLLLPDEPSGRVWPERYREVPTGRKRPAEKRNLGLDLARGPIIAFLDDDAFPCYEWLERAVGYFSLPDVGGIGGPAITPLNDPYLAKLSGTVFENRLVSGGYRYRYAPGRVREIDDYPSCNFIVRTDAVKALGGFRNDFWPGEDTYLCMEIAHRLNLRLLYDPRVLAYHHRRPLFLPHLRQIGRYGLHRGYFARRFPATSRRISYMLPSLFVLGLVGGGIASVWLAWLRPVYYMAAALYAAITLIFAANWNPLSWLLVWIGIVLTHIVYGARFLLGFLAQRLPGEVQKFDHPSEERQL